MYTNPQGSSDNNDDYPLRLLLSSFYPNGDGTPGSPSGYPPSYGIPDGKSSCALCTVSCDTCQYDYPAVQAYQANATSYTGPWYTRTHRDVGIINAMRAWVNLPPMTEAELYA